MLNKAFKSVSILKELDTDLAGFSHHQNSFCQIYTSTACLKTKQFECYWSVICMPDYLRGRPHAFNLFVSIRAP